MDELGEKISELEAIYNRRKGQKEQLENSLNRNIERLNDVVKKRELYENVRKLLEMAAEYARDQAKGDMEYMVTQALQYVFENDLEFKIELEDNASGPQAEFYVESRYGGEQLVKTRPQDARGGGVVDVISLALRIAMMQGRGVLILDEPAKQVSEEFAPNVANFLRYLTNQGDFQVVMVSHNQHLAQAAGKSYIVSIKDGISRVSEVSSS
ncbi:MAG: ATP-binding protein [Thermoanaerobacteraceae bacterium]|nr:ATP-binding protein [Thermoanaerobacteraceae bacterium]